LVATRLADPRLEVPHPRDAFDDETLDNVRADDTTRCGLHR
jgi:hypothetical protein